MAPSGGPRDTTVCTIGQEGEQEGATWVGSVAKWLLPHLDRLGYLKGFWYTSGVLMLRVAQGSNVPALAHASSPSGVGGFERAAPSAADPEEKLCIL